MISPKFRLQFFDSKAVIAAVDRATRQALSKAGAFIRQRARTSMRKRKAVAPSGSPPSVHEGSLKRLLFFSWDPQAKSVVIGPIPFRDGKAPSLLEFGGDVTRTSPRGGKSRTMHYAGNPVMGPALRAEVAAGSLPKSWANAVKSG